MSAPVREREKITEVSSASTIAFLTEFSHSSLFFGLVKIERYRLHVLFLPICSRAFLISGWKIIAMITTDASKNSLSSEESITKLKVDAIKYTIKSKSMPFRS